MEIYKAVVTKILMNQTGSIWFQRQKCITRRHPPHCHRDHKKGVLNTPSAILFFKRKTVALIYISKPPLRLTRANYNTAETTVKYL